MLSSERKKWKETLGPAVDSGDDGWIGVEVGAGDMGICSFVPLFFGFFGVVFKVNI